jgi:ribonuclease Y
MFTTIIITAIVSAAVTLAIYLFVRNVILKKKKEQIIINAEKEGEDIKKEKIFQAKEKIPATQK